MIQVEICLKDEVRVATVWMRLAPEVGHALWFAGATYDAVRRVHGTGEFKVTAVAHGITDMWSPSTHVGDPIHSLWVEVEPIGE